MIYLFIKAMEKRSTKYHLNYFLSYLNSNYYICILFDKISLYYFRLLYLASQSKIYKNAFPFPITITTSKDLIYPN